MISLCFDHIFLNAHFHLVELNICHSNSRNFFIQHLNLVCIRLLKKKFEKKISYKISQVLIFVAEKHVFKHRS